MAVPFVFANTTDELYDVALARLILLCTIGFEVAVCQ